MDGSTNTTTVYIASVSRTADQTMQSPGMAVMLFFSDVLANYVWMVTAIFGIPGNILCLLISLQKENRRFSTCIYMAGIAIVDTISLVIVVVSFMKMYWIKSATKEFHWQWVYYFGYSMSILSGFFLAMMSIDRLIVVRVPLLAKQRCTTSNAWRAVAVSTVAVMVINTHIFVAYKEFAGILKVIIPGHPALEILCNMYMLVCGSLIPFLIIVLCNIWIIITLKIASEDRKKMGVASTLEKDTHHLTRMLIFICVAYVVTSLPHRLYEMVLAAPALEQLYDFSDDYWSLRYKVQYLTIVNLWYVNFSSTFYLYCVGGGKKYRADVKRLLFLCKGE
ncbi:cysteinyl leukotriene receptor 1-like [Lineus longissimus]|uniref:cysteinyl leukotriene receptor 1-like n=1 Tax=Lineus longissimus TaxID=88925 RepID=UPI002B4F1047